MNHRKWIIAERFHFYQRNQLAGESIAGYVAALRKLATHCEFEEKLQEALRDKFMCGLRKEATQRKLLTETKIPTIEQAVELTKKYEVVEPKQSSFMVENLCIVLVSTIAERVGKDHKVKRSQTVGLNGNPATIVVRKATAHTIADTESSSADNVKREVIWQKPADKVKTRDESRIKHITLRKMTFQYTN